MAPTETWFSASTASAATTAPSVSIASRSLRLVATKSSSTPPAIVRPAIFGFIRESSVNDARYETSTPTRSGSRAYTRHDSKKTAAKIRQLLLYDQKQCVSIAAHSMAKATASEASRPIFSSVIVQYIQSNVALAKIALKYRFASQFTPNNSKAYLIPR